MTHPIIPRTSGAPWKEGPRKGSTKGRSIKQATNVLRKGEACLTCKVRKVCCSGESPACASCLRSYQFSRRYPTSCVCKYPGEVKRHIKREHDSLELESRSVAEAEVYSPPKPVCLHDTTLTDGVLTGLLGADSTAFWSMSPSDALLDLSFATPSPRIPHSSPISSSSTWSTNLSPTLPQSYAPFAPHAFHLPGPAEPVIDQRGPLDHTLYGYDQSAYTSLFVVEPHSVLMTGSPGWEI